MDIETFRILQDPTVTLFLIWGMVCITALAITIVAYTFSMMNNIFNHMFNRPKKVYREELSFTPTGKPKGSPPITNK